MSDILTIIKDKILKEFDNNEMEAIMNNFQKLKYLTFQNVSL